MMDEKFPGASGAALAAYQLTQKSRLTLARQEGAELKVSLEAIDEDQMATQGQPMVASRMRTHRDCHVKKDAEAPASFLGELIEHEASRDCEPHQPR